MRATVDPTLGIRSRPADCISQNQLRTRIEIDGIHFVSGRKIENFPVAAFPGAAGTKNLAAFEPRNKNNFVRRRDREWLTVHFGVGDLEAAIDRLTADVTDLLLEFGGALSGRDTTAVQKTISGLLKLLQPDPKAAPPATPEARWPYACSPAAKRPISRRPTPRSGIPTPTKRTRSGRRG